MAVSPAAPELPPAPSATRELRELVQIDGSDHRWFENRGEPCTLLVFIDAATSKLMQLRLVPNESTDSYFEALKGYVNEHGCPVAFYSDKHTVFRVNRPDAKGGSGMTQFGRALAEILDMKASNAFLPEFMKHYNEKFSLSAVRAQDLRRKLIVQASRLVDILCHREQRHVG